MAKALSIVVFFAAVIAVSGCSVTRAVIDCATHPQACN